MTVFATALLVAYNNSDVHSLRIFILLLDFCYNAYTRMCLKCGKSTKIGRRIATHTHTCTLSSNTTTQTRKHPNILRRAAIRSKHVCLLVNLCARTVAHPSNQAENVANAKTTRTNGHSVLLCEWYITFDFSKILKRIWAAVKAFLPA